MLEVEHEMPDTLIIDPNTGLSINMPLGPQRPGNWWKTPDGVAALLAIDSMRQLRNIKIDDEFIEITTQKTPNALDYYRNLVKDETKAAEFAIETKAARRVRSAEGSKKFNLPIGAVIGTGGPDFRPTSVTVHHSNTPGDQSRAIVSAGPKGVHASIHKTAESANNQMDDLLDENQHIVHVRHNIRGRQFRLTGDNVHVQQEDGSFRQAGEIVDSPDGRMIARPSGVGRGKAGDNMHDLLSHLVKNDEAQMQLIEDPDRVFAITARLREVLNSVENKNMRDPKSGETKTHDGQPIPPGWTQVEIAKNASNPLQARGRDSLGNIQGIYSLEHKKKGLDSKFRRTHEVVKAMPKLDAVLTARNLNSSDTHAVVFIMRHTGARVDSSTGDKDRVANTVKGITSYGASTLLAKHVKVRGNVTHLNFVGKSGKHNIYKIEDATFARAMRMRLKSKGSNDRLFDTNAIQTGALIKSSLGVNTDRPNHDLRTHVATSMAAQMVNELADDDYPQNEKEYKQYLKWIGTAVGEQINDGWTVAMANYVDPSVLKPLERDL